MPWTLEIHHIDVGQGDSTLVIAKFVDPLNNANNETKSLLIDAGKVRAGVTPRAETYFRTKANLNKVDIIVATHYDDDHYTSIEKILLAGITYVPNSAVVQSSVYNNTPIYDQGEPPDSTIKGKASRSPFGRTSNRPSDFSKYVTAVNLGSANRVTRTVNSFKIVKRNNNGTYSLPDAQAIPGTANNYLSPDWLVGKEILWGNADPANYSSTLPVGKPNAPTVTCIAANKWVRNRVLVNGNPVIGTAYVTHSTFFNGDTQDSFNESENKNDNEKSLAFLIQFNNFRYYIGGDIEQYQEDGCTNPNNLQVIPGASSYLNPTDDFVGRVHVIKTSHHGSNKATSTAFLDRLRPLAAVISCGYQNRHGLPHANVIGRLDAAYSANDHKMKKYYLTSDGNINGARGVIAGTGATNNGKKQTAGDGHIIVIVTEADSLVANSAPTIDPLNNAQYLSNSSPFTVQYEMPAPTVNPVNDQY